METQKMTFESRWYIEDQPIVCIEDEYVPVWNQAEMDAFLLDGVYYRRCYKQSDEECCLFDRADRRYCNG